MSEEKNDPASNEKPAIPKKPKIFAPKKNTVGEFNKNKNRFLSPRPGSTGKKGGGFKSGGMKKGS